MVSCRMCGLINMGDAESLHSVCHSLSPLLGPFFRRHNLSHDCCNPLSDSCCALRRHQFTQQPHKSDWVLAIASSARYRIKPTLKCSALLSRLTVPVDTFYFYKCTALVVSVRKIHRPSEHTIFSADSSAIDTWGLQIR
jgi:hypothetical protein